MNWSRVLAEALGAVRGGAEFDVNMQRTVHKLTENGAPARPTADTTANMQIHRGGKMHRLLECNRW